MREQIDVLPVPGIRFHVLTLFLSLTSSVLFSFIFSLLTSFLPSAPILTCFLHLVSVFSSFCRSPVAALQTRPVHSQRARCHTCGWRLGSLESLRYLFADLRRGHQDRCARMQPASVCSSPSLCSHACPVDLVSILAAKVSVP